MALNFNLKAKTFVYSRPQVDRSPQWFNGVFYAPGSIVARYFVNNLDSDLNFTNWYVNRLAVEPGQSAPESNSNWTLFISTDPDQPNFFKDSEVYNYIDNAQSDYTKKYINTDSDITVLNRRINVLNEIDSELTKVQHRTLNLEEENIIDRLFDSERRHDHAIVWDSDADKFKFSTLVKTVNSRTPDADGNVEITFSGTGTGPRDSRPDSEVDGSFWIVSGDSETDANSTLYIYNRDAGAWRRVIGYSDVENDRLYISATGDTMTGALKVPTPVGDSDAVPKQYIDNYDDVTKQEKIIVFDSEFQMPPTASLYPEGTMGRVTINNTLWFIKGGAWTKFIIPPHMSADPTLTEVRVQNLNNGILRVFTYRFSDVELGKLYLTKGDSPTRIFLGTNATGGQGVSSSIENFRLLNGSLQYFDIQIDPLAYTPYGTYTIKYVSHNGNESSITIRGLSTNRIMFGNTGRSLNYGEF